MAARPDEPLGTKVRERGLPFVPFAPRGEWDLPAVRGLARAARDAGGGREAPPTLEGADYGVGRLSTRGSLSFTPSDPPMMSAAAFRAFRQVPEHRARLHLVDQSRDQLLGIPAEQNERNPVLAQVPGQGAQRVMEPPARRTTQRPHAADLLIDVHRDDLAISAAIHRMPREWIARSNALEATLRARRDRLPQAARRFRHTAYRLFGAEDRPAAAVVAGDTQAPAVSITSPASGASVSGLVGINITASDNVGVARVELRVNSTTVAVDTSAPFAFTWDSGGVPNGMASLVAYAFDAAGNSKASTAVSVNVANGTTTVSKDTTAPQVKIVNPVAGNVSGNNVPISVNASDDSGASGITHMLYIDGVLDGDITEFMESYLQWRRSGADDAGNN